MASKKQYVLTISLLASNRKDTLPKTLESLKPILDNVSSELIVVDTGCDEELLGIVRQYTDKIIKFTWCNDFSKARNVGIDNAKGDWFMFIDDDEWFESVDQFIEFFNSDQKDKYGYGQYIVRNYDNFEGTSWMDSVAGRIFKLFDTTRFVDAVHERPINIAGPTKEFTEYAHHYGYVYKTEEDRQAHYKRNVTLLMKQVESEPDRVRHYCHLTQEYNTQNEYDKSLEWAYKGIENANMSDTDNKKDIVGLYGNIVWVLVNQKKHKAVLDKSHEYLKSPYMNKLGELALYGFCAIAEYLLENYEKSIEYVDKFIERYTYLDEHVAERFSMDAILVTSAMEHSNYVRVVGIGMTAAATNHRFDALERYSSLLDFSEVKRIIDDSFCMEYIIDMIAESETPEKYQDIIKNVVKNSNYLSYIITHLGKIREENYVGFVKAAHLLAETSENNGYVQYLRIISAAAMGKTEQLSALYEKAIHDISDVIDISHEFWQIAAENKIDIASMIAKQPLYRFNEAVDQWASTVKIKELIEKIQDLSMVLPSDCIQMKYIGTKIAEAFLIRKRLDDITIEELDAELKKFYTTVISFYKGIYREVIFEMYASILPKNCQAALYMRDIVDTNDREVKADLLKKVMKLMPNLNEIVAKYEELL